MQNLSYLEMPPCDLLKPFIVCYWMIESDFQAPVSLADRTFPDGCQEIVFNLGNTVARKDPAAEWSKNPDVELIGQMTRYYDLKTYGRQRFFGIKFLPHSFAVFTNTAISELKDSSVDLSMLFKTGFQKWCDEVYVCEKISHFADRADQYLVSQFDSRKSSSRAYKEVDFIARRILSEPRLSIEDLLRQHVSLRPRRLQELFIEYCGVSPKYLQRMHRFQMSFRYLRKSACQLTETALRCGYYDQAHFNREFRYFSGFSPTEYLNSFRPLNRFFVDADHQVYIA